MSELATQRRASRRTSGSVAFVRPVASLVGLLLFYYSVPLDWTVAAPRLAVLLTVVGAAVLGWAITAQVLHHVRGSTPVGLPSLVMLLLLVLVVFALGYLALETARPGQFEDLHTRTDSLYFTMQVLTTVGLGDVHAVGQTARALVTGQMAFDLVFVGAAVSVAGRRFRSRTTRPQEDA